MHRTFVLLFLWQMAVVSNAQVLTRGQVYDFDPGNVFQSKYISYMLTPSGPPGYLTDSVMARSWSVGMDTVHYQVHRRTYQPPSGPGLPPYIHDTVLVLSYGDLGLPAAHYQLPAPCQPVLDSLSADPGFCGLATWVQYTSGDTCFEPDTWTSTLIAGCGGPYYWSLQFAGPLHQVHELQYFNKGGMECGDLVTGIRNVLADAPVLTIHPNPGTSFRISGLGDTPARLTVLDLLGRVVLERASIRNGATVDGGLLPAGTYLVEVQEAVGRIRSRWWVRE